MHMVAASSRRFSLVFALAMHVVVGGGHSDGVCLTMTGLKAVLASSKVTPCRGFTPTTRYVTCNHKTGTLFAQCLCGVVENNYEDVRCVAGGYPKSHNMGMQHSHGFGISQRNFGVNLVRNPFVMVHSGMSYHRTTRNKGEGWLFEKKPIEERTRFGVARAAELYSDWCVPGKTELNTSLNFQQIMNVGVRSGVCAGVEYGWVHGWRKAGWVDGWYRW